jgi:phosphoglycolate phosphatase
MIKDIEAVIFDLDGTLVRLPINYEKLFREFAKILKTLKIHPILETISKVDKETQKRLFEIWTKAENEALPELEVIEEGIEIYRRFSDRKKALVTMQGREIVERILEKTGLSFDYVVTREDSLSRFQQITIVIKRFAVFPQRVLVVGDRESDKKAAEKLGCNFLFVNEKALESPC